MELKDTEFTKAAKRKKKKRNDNAKVYRALAIAKGLQNFKKTKNGKVMIKK